MKEGEVGSQYTNVQRSKNRWEYRLGLKVTVWSMIIIWLLQILTSECLNIIDTYLIREKGLVNSCTWTMSQIPQNCIP